MRLRKSPGGPQSDFFAPGTYEPATGHYSPPRREECRSPKPLGTAFAPCGSCPVCLRRYHFFWAYRTVVEVLSNPRSWFVTLTYSSLEPPACADDWKSYRWRLRRAIGPFRYIASLEVGWKGQRADTGNPHWHAIIISDCARDALLDAWIGPKSKRDAEGNSADGRRGRIWDSRVLYGLSVAPAHDAVTKAMSMALYVCKYLTKSLGEQGLADYERASSVGRYPRKVLCSQNWGYVPPDPHGNPEAASIKPGPHHEAGPLRDEWNELERWLDAGFRVEGPSGKILLPAIDTVRDQLGRMKRARRRNGVTKTKGRGAKTSEARMATPAAEPRSSEGAPSRATP